MESRATEVGSGFCDMGKMLKFTRVAARVPEVIRYKEGQPPKPQTTAAEWSLSRARLEDFHVIPSGGSVVFLLHELFIKE